VFAITPVVIHICTAIGIVTAIKSEYSGDPYSVSAFELVDNSASKCPNQTEERLEITSETGTALVAHIIVSKEITA